MKLTKRQLNRLILEVMSSMELIDDETIPQQFKKWAVEYMGTPSGANSSSVLATFLVQHEYDKDKALVAGVADDLGFDLSDVAMEVKRQRREYDAGGVVSDQESYKRSFKESKMKITRRQLRRIIREEISQITQPLREGYMVPKFHSTDDTLRFIEEMEPDDEVETDVIDPETGELVIPAGETPRDQDWWEEVTAEEEKEKEGVEEEEEEYDWDAYEARLEAEQEAKMLEDERIQNMVTDQATDAGEDWAGDTLYDAKNNPDMWKQYNAESAEDYVMAFGQDAAADMSDNLLQYGEHDVSDWWNNLPDKERPYDNRPTKQVMRDIVADYFYDGVSKALAKKAA